MFQHFQLKSIFFILLLNCMIITWGKQFFKNLFFINLIRNFRLNYSPSLVNLLNFINVNF